MLVILIGVIGGMISYGIIGLFIGPIVLAFSYKLFMVWLTDGDAITEAEAEASTGAPAAAGQPTG